jgi:hypothetical protein
MQKTELVGSVAAGMGETRIEVVLCQQDGREVVALQLSTWHETLGWQAQKTIPFGAEKIGQLQRLLTQTRNLIEDRAAPAGVVAQVIELAARGSSAPAIMPTQPTAQNDDQAFSAIN